MSTLRQSLWGLTLTCAAAVAWAGPPDAVPGTEVVKPANPAARSIPVVVEESKTLPAPKISAHPATEAHVEEEHGAWLIHGEFVFWAPRRRSQDYAILGTNPNWGPVGTVKSLEGGYDPGFRIGGGYRFATGLEVTGTYTHWHTAAEEQVTATGTDRLFPTLTHPAFVVQVDSARASNSANLNVFDLEFARRFELYDNTRLRAFFGPRFANLDQKYTATYEGGDVVGSDRVTRNQTFDGGGLRVGGDADFRLLEHLGLMVRGSASMMTGRIRTNLEDIQNGAPVVNVVDRFNKVVPTADLGVGLTYSRGGMKLSVGYELHNWFGAVEGLDFVDDAAPAKMTRRAADLGFDGVFFRAEWSY